MALETIKEPEATEQESMDESEYLSVDELDAAGEIFVTCNGQSW